MRKIENKTWTINYRFKNEKGEMELKEGKESLLTALSTLLNMAEEKDIPRGFDKFRAFGKRS